MELTEDERQLISVLDRQTTCDTLGALVAAMRPAPSNAPLAETAIGLDANVFLRLVNYPRSADLIDYLGSSHPAPLILPGQAIQEFWNNQSQVVETVALSVRRQFDGFRAALSRIDADFAEYTDKIKDMLEDFNTEHGHRYDEATLRRALSLLEAIARKAQVVYAPRVRFQEIARLRRSTKTPPGFRDDGDGDFFIWVDFLTGLQRARAEQQAFSRVVLVSLDRKIDWSRAGVAHPILVAEVKALLDVPFEIWTLDKLSAEIAAAT